MSRFKSNIYFIEKFIYRDHQHCIITSDDDTLFSGVYKTKIKASDLPDWYVYGRYYKRFGYMSTKGITDLLYVPSMTSNHLLKDDCLYVSYSGRIEKSNAASHGFCYEKYQGFDERVWGSEIIQILKGARIYSNYNISRFIEQLKEKAAWLRAEFPNEFGPNQWDLDVEKAMSEPIYNRG